MIGMTPPRDNALSFAPPIVQRYSKAAHELARKLARQQQRLIVNWSELANDSIESFTRDTCLELFSTRGRRLRALDGRKFRKLTIHEFAHLWNIVRTELDGRGVKLTVRKIENGLKAVGLIAPMPEMPASRMRGAR